MNELGYRGNENLKKVGEDIELTEDQLREYIRCMEDPVYFARNYIKIVHVDHGLIPLNLYEYQEEILEKITNNRRVAVCTSRQAGKTTTAVAVILHYILFNEFKSVGVLGNKQDTAVETLDRVKLAYEALPKWMQHGVKIWHRKSIELENGCKVLAAATSASAIRGKSLSLLYIDETAMVENWEEFSASVLPTISSGNTTKMLYTSTPKGLNHFHKTCKLAQLPEDDPKWNGFQYVEVPWHRVPGRGEQWKKEALAELNGDEQKFAQEYECVGYDTCITVRNKVTGVVETLKIGELYDRITNDNIQDNPV